MFGYERGAEPAISERSSKLEVLWAKSREIDREVWARTSHRFQGFTFTTGERQIVDCAVICQAFAASHFTYDFNCLSHTLKRSLETHSVPSFHYLWPANAKPKYKAILR